MAPPNKFKSGEGGGRLIDTFADDDQAYFLNVGGQGYGDTATARDAVLCVPTLSGWYASSKQECSTLQEGRI